MARYLGEVLCVEVDSFTSYIKSEEILIEFDPDEVSEAQDVKDIVRAQTGLDVVSVLWLGRL